MFGSCWVFWYGFLIDFGFYMLNDEINLLEIVVLFVDIMKYCVSK